VKRLVGGKTDLVEAGRSRHVLVAAEGRGGGASRGRRRRRSGREGRWQRRQRGGWRRGVRDVLTCSNGSAEGGDAADTAIREGLQELRAAPRVDGGRERRRSWRRLRRQRRRRRAVHGRLAGTKAAVEAAVATSPAAHVHDPRLVRHKIVAALGLRQRAALAGRHAEAYLEAPLRRRRREFTRMALVGARAMHAASAFRWWRRRGGGRGGRRRRLAARAAVLLGEIVLLSDRPLGSWQHCAIGAPAFRHVCTAPKAVAVGEAIGISARGVWHKR